MLFSQFEKNLQATQSLTDFNVLLETYLEKFSIKTFAFTYYSYYPNSQNKVKYDFSSKNFARWHKHYIDECYEDIDSTLDVVYQTTLPTFWDLQQQLKAAKTPREKQMRLDSLKFGAEKGVSIPIHGPQEDFAILLLVQMKGEKCLEKWLEIQSELFAAAYYFYFYLQKKMVQEHFPNQSSSLSQRELQCLQLIAKQYSTEKIANQLGLTERTVNYHIQRLNKKLGVKNKYQALIKALQKKLIAL